MTVLTNGMRDSPTIRKWMQEFLACDGLGVLLESLEKLGSRGFSSVADTISQLQCVGCLRAVMSCQVGLQYIIQHREYTRQLANILMSHNNSVKLQVFELLCALCMYSSQGHSLALDSLNNFKMSHGRRYRFDLVVHELRTADTVAYQTTLLAFINCLILGAADIPQRNRLRTELFGVGLERALSQLRFADEDGLQIQLKVFDDNQAKDEEHDEPLSVPHLFEVVHQKVANTPQVLWLQSILLALSHIDPDDPASDSLWESLQEVVVEAQSKHRPKRKTSFVKTRDFSTQTIGNRWISTKRRKTCSVGVQAGPEKTSDQFNPITKNSEIGEELPQLLSNLTISSNTSVEICKNCQRRFVRGETQTEPSSTNQLENGNIPRTETKSPELSPTTNRRASFTKIKKAHTAQSLNQHSITVDEPLIKNLNPTQQPPPPPQKSPSEIVSRTLSEAIAPPPPILPNGELDSGNFSRSSSFSSCVPSPPPPPPPPLPCDSPPLFLATPPGQSVGSPAFTPPPPPPFPAFSPSPPPPPPFPPNYSNPSPPTPFSSSCAPPPPPLPSFISTPSPPPPPPPPPPFPSPASPPPPPLPGFAPNVCSTPVTSRVVEPLFVAHRAPANYHTLPTRRPHDMESSFHKFNTLPRPSKKMKTLNWAKVPNQVIGKSVWACATLPLVTIDYSQMDELFCQKPRPKSVPAQSSLESQTPALTTLLESKRSLTVNIFLKQFKTGASGVLEAIRKCDSLSAEKLKGLLKILPEDHEVSLVQSHPGELSGLDTAERFYAELIQIPEYTLRINAMLQKEECATTVADLTPQLESVMSMCDSLINNSSLAEFFALLLQLGNYLNAGSYAGNAAGFRLSTLPKMLDTRANKPRMTFLHFAVDVARAHSPDLLAFTEDASTLRNIARNPLSALEEDIKALATSVRKLDKQLSATKSKEITTKFKEFVVEALSSVLRLEGQLAEARVAERRLADHFCEDPTKFHLEECCALLADFFVKIKQADLENEQRKKQEERAAKMVAVKASMPIIKKTKSKKIFQDEQEVNLVDILMNEIKGGNFKLRQSIPPGNG